MAHVLGFELDFLVVYATGLVMSVSIHEFSHAFALYLLGDRSARTRERLSLRPDLHFKWWGYLMLLFLGVIVGNPVFIEKNEAEIKYNWYYVLIVTKLAGPLSNLLTAIITLLLLKYINGYPNIEEVGFGYVWVRLFFKKFQFGDKLLNVYDLTTYGLLAGFLLSGLRSYSLYFYDLFLKFRQLMP